MVLLNGRTVGWAMLGSIALTHAIDLDVADPNSIKKAAATAAANMLTFYHGEEPGRILGLMDKPYYWWEGGAMFGQLINYWALTGDTQYNAMTIRGIQFQVGEDNDFEPKNRTNELGNDDQQFWAFSVMDAAESGFPDPAPNQPSWLALAQAVFNRQITRWEPEQCGGGLRWQTTPFNKGWTYKNTPSNAGLFHLSARLARYTGNQTYAEWAKKLWDWEHNVGYIQKGQNGGYIVYDGAHEDHNCTDINQIQWSYNYGTLLSGASYMYSMTNGDAYWKAQVDALILGMKLLFVGKSPSPDKQPDLASGEIVSEVACEHQTPQTCTQDQPAFKAFLLRWMAVTTQLVPHTRDQLTSFIRSSAQAAAPLCVSVSGTFCNRRWYQATPDGFTGLGEQMSALSAFQNLLIGSAKAPFTHDSGGSSRGDPSAGTNKDSQPVVYNPITTADKAGAGIVTAILLGSQIAAAYWMMLAKE